MISYGLLLLIPCAAAVGVFLLIRGMHRLSLRVQFLVLLGLGVSIGFIFLVMVQMPEFPTWLGVSLIAVVFVASLFGTRIFLRSMSQEDKKAEEDARGQDGGGFPPAGLRSMKPGSRTP
jgi:membrane protein implicated in regulation of membrane protease activity